MKLLILWQWGGLTRQIISCLDASSSVAVLPWHRFTDLTLLQTHQALERGHLLLQRWGDPGKEGATFDKLGVETAKTNISAQWCIPTGHRLLKLQKWYYREAEPSFTFSPNHRGVFVAYGAREYLNGKLEWASNLRRVMAIYNTSSHTESWPQSPKNYMNKKTIFKYSCNDVTVSG